ncbi:hypothetical protein D1007_50572 [Hordeum vulgare]|nr:hypothetical protein D1007_50572 [Hordeum vulgare]
MVEGSHVDIVNLKFLLLCYEAMLGLKINFDKSEVFVLGYSSEDHIWILNNLKFKISAFPTSFLGMSLAESKILAMGFDHLVDQVASQAEPWQGRLTSKTSKTVLISHNMACVPIFMMGMYMYTMPESVHSSFDKDLPTFFWQGAGGCQKYHMVKWADICVPKERGRLGFTASRVMNTTLILR